MPLDSLFYENIIKSFEENIRLIFNEDMLGISKEHDFKNRGYFKILYRYIPYNYKIVIENEMRIFDINIVDSEGASNSLYRINHFNSNLDEQNIADSLLLLKNVLERNEFNFYFHIDDKLYKKNKTGIKRVKDIRELLNG